MTDRELIELALKALESGLAFSTHSPVLQNLRAALEQQAEPVAYKAVSKITGAVQYYAALPSYIDPVSWDILPLFDPPQRKPLTAEKVLDLFDAHNVYGSKWLEFARAVEAAHGIKETP